MLRQQWKHSEEDLSLFKRKLDSFLQMLEQTHPISWSLFLSRELQLLDLSLRDFRKIFNQNHLGLFKEDESTLLARQTRLRRRFLSYEMDSVYNSLGRVAY